MKIFVRTPDGKTAEVELRDNALAKDAAAAVKINAETVLFAKKITEEGEAEIVPDITELRKGDRLELIKVVSGG